MMLLRECFLEGGVFRQIFLQGNWDPSYSCVRRRVHHLSVLTSDLFTEPWQYFIQLWIFLCLICMFSACQGTFFSCRVAAMGAHLTGDGQGCWLKDSKRVLGGYLLLTPPGWGLCSELSLELPDLCPLWNYWWLAIFATDLQLISSCSKQQMRGGTKFSVEMHGPEPASNLSPRN